MQLEKNIICHCLLPLSCIISHLTAIFHLKVNALSMPGSRGFPSPISHTLRLDLVIALVLQGHRGIVHILLLSTILLLGLTHIPRFRTQKKKDTFSGMGGLVCLTHADLRCGSFGSERCWNLGGSKLELGVH